MLNCQLKEFMTAENKLKALHYDHQRAAVLCYT